MRMRMRMLPPLLLLALSAPGCDDEGTCLNGVCADRSETRLRPGPCAVAARDAYERCDLTYDAEDRPVTASCGVYATPIRGTYAYPLEASWTYDATTGEIASHERRDSRTPDVERWTWSRDEVRIDAVKTSGPPELLALYDRTLFAYTPEPTNVHFFPRAELGIVRGRDGGQLVDYAWTRSGNRLTVMGPHGTFHFDLDDRGRLIASDLETFEYSGDQLVSETLGEDRIDYLYDAGGNVSEAVDALGTLEVYDYSCW